MSKIVDSPSKRWPGTVKVCSPMGLKQFITFSSLWEESKQHTESYAEYMYSLLPGILACVEEWNLGGDFPKNVTQDTFPAIPFDESSKLFAVLLTAIWRDAREAENAPNA